MRVIRHISLEDDFMNQYINDLLYAYLLYHSSKDSNNNIYITQTKYLKMREPLQRIFKTSSKTLKRYLDRLIEKGLLSEGYIITDSGKEIKSYILLHPKARYQSIDRDMLKWLANIGNKHTLQLYIYLLNKYSWKKDYSFSVAELMRVLGYHEQSKTARKTIRVTLTTMDALNVIKIKTTMENIIGNDGIPHSVPKFLILNICTEAPKEVKEIYRADSDEFIF